MIQLGDGLTLGKNDAGYTVFYNGLGFPLIATDAPYERLKNQEGYKEQFIKLLMESKNDDNSAEIEKVLEDIKELTQ